MASTCPNIRSVVRSAGAKPFNLKNAVVAICLPFDETGR
jgi:hypothetical protein